MPARRILIRASGTSGLSAARVLGAAAFLLVAASKPSPIFAQGVAAAPPPAVGVAKISKQPITETEKFVGRIQAVSRVDVVARVSAFVDEVAFRDGVEVKKGDVLYRLQRAPFEADLDARKAVAAQMSAQLQNADSALERARSLLKTQAGTQATVDTAIANQRSFAAQLQGAQANVKQSQINLDYTVIVSPIDGKVGRTSITPGNVVSAGSGVLTTIVSQDPMYVTFPVSVRTATELRNRYADMDSDVVIRVTLPDGSAYPQTGKLDFIDNTVQGGTDTILLRGVIPNPVKTQQNAGVGSIRQLIDNEFVTVNVEGAAPVQVFAAPRSAVLIDQRGSYVYVVGPDNIARRQDVKVGQSTPTMAALTGGVKEGDTIVVEGLQRVRPGQPVSPGAPTAPKLPGVAPGAR